MARSANTQQRHILRGQEEFNVMSNEDELVKEFWAALEPDRMVMLGLTAAEDGHTRPMTAQLDEGRHNIWFFTSKQAPLVQKLKSDSQACVTFVSKNYGIFASVHGRLVQNNAPEMIDQLWNAEVPKWYKGKTDPAIALLNFKSEKAEIWRQGSSLFAGFKVLFGADPKEIYKDNVAKVKLA
jgi:general stress protein 26